MPHACTQCTACLRHRRAAQSWRAGLRSIWAWQRGQRPGLAWPAAAGAIAGARLRSDSQQADGRGGQALPNIDVLGRGDADQRGRLRMRRKGLSPGSTHHLHACMLALRIVGASKQPRADSGRRGTHNVDAHSDSLSSSLSVVQQHGGNRDRLGHSGSSHRTCSMLCSNFLLDHARCRTPSRSAYCSSSAPVEKILGLKPTPVAPAIAPKASAWSRQGLYDSPVGHAHRD